MKWPRSIHDLFFSKITCFWGDPSHAKLAHLSLLLPSPDQLHHDIRAYSHCCFPSSLP